MPRFTSSCAFTKIQTYRRIFDNNQETPEDSQNGKQEEGEPRGSQTNQVPTVPSFCCPHPSAFDEHQRPVKAGGQGTRGTGVSIDKISCSF